MDHKFQPHDLKILKPEVKEVYERRVAYHEMMSDLLENNMIEVTEEVKKTTNAEGENETAKNEDEDETAKNLGEDEKQQEEEKK